MNKRTYLTMSMALVIACSITFSSCIGSFGLTNQVLSWNKNIGKKFVNELVFVAFWIVPVYEITGLADILVINSIEFWSGRNPATGSSEKVIDGKDARYLVQQSPEGYLIKNLNDSTEVRFAFDASDDSWSIQSGDKSYKFMTYTDDNNVRMIMPNGAFEPVQLNESGLYAYQQVAANNGAYAMR